MGLKYKDVINLVFVNVSFVLNRNVKVRVFIKDHYVRKCIIKSGNGDIWKDSFVILCHAHIRRDMNICAQFA